MIFSKFVPSSISAGIGLNLPDTEDEANNIDDETKCTVRLLFESDFGYDDPMAC